MENKFLQMFLEILESDTLPDLDDSFLNLKGWDSLAVLSLISMVDDEFGVIIGSADLENMATVRDILEFVKTSMR